MPLAKSEASMWDGGLQEKPTKADDRDINDRYLRGEGRIVIETNREKLPGFVNLLKTANYMDLRPFYQRRPRWSERQQSLLIESFIMNIPVPPVFLYEKDYNAYEVMDGQQRITAIRDFYANTFKLTGLEMWPELNGRSYNSLPEKIKAGIDRRSITSIVLMKESTESEEDASFLRETVFDRLNTGGVKLERQEIRNALYRSDFNGMLNDLSKLDEFRDIWGIPRFVENEIETTPGILDNTLFAKMGDIEIILRFFALRHASHYRNGMQGFLDIYMRKAVSFSVEDVGYLKGIFVETLHLARTIYGTLVFRPFSASLKKWDAKPHKAFQDAVMIGLSEFLDSKKELEDRKADVVAATQALFEQHPQGTFTGRGNTKQDVIERIDLYRKMIAGILGR
jgi:hypothetical protein